MIIGTLKIRDERQLKAMTGLSEDQFDVLEKAFGQAYENKKQKDYEEGIKNGKRKRKPGGGIKGKLPTVRIKLFFLLFYLKTYPTFDVLGMTFNMSRSKACKNVHRLLPVLLDTLSNIGVLPHRNFDNPDEMRKALGDIDTIIIDATERLHRRPQNSEKQSSMYSGKKKKHTIKNTVISSVDKIILFLGKTFTGHTHDYKMLKEEFPPELPWFKDVNGLADLGYQGIQNDYEDCGIMIPNKKPRKSKKNPNPELTEEQKNENRNLSRIRIFVENVIGGIKRYNILIHAFRNMKENFEDDVIALCAGLWNMTITA